MYWVCRLPRWDTNGSILSADAFNAVHRVRTLRHYDKYDATQGSAPGDGLHCRSLTMTSLPTIAPTTGIRNWLNATTTEKLVNSTFNYRGVVATSTEHENYGAVQITTTVSSSSSRTEGNVVTSGAHQTSSFELMTNAGVMINDSEFRYSTEVDSQTSWRATDGEAVIVVQLSTSPSSPSSSWKLNDNPSASLTPYNPANDVIIRSYYVIVAILIALTVIAAVGLVVRRILRLAAGNGLQLPYHVTGGGAPYTSVDDEQPCCRRSCCESVPNCCFCCCCCLMQHSCNRSPMSPVGNKYDYIYRPLGGGSGNRIEDEYETTFVGVSIPLLHEVSDI